MDGLDVLAALYILAQTDKMEERMDGYASGRRSAEQKKGRSLEELYRGSKECQVAKEGRIEGIKTRSHKLKVVDRMR